MEESYYGHRRADVAALVPSIGSNGRVLEIGCGKGEFRTNFPQVFEYWGVEPSAAAAEVARTSFSKVIASTYEGARAGIPDGYFDVIVCNDVIEHMVNPFDFLREIKEKLKVDGVIVGSVPNVRFVGNLFDLLIRKDWKYVDSGILDRTHLRFFTEKSLRRALSDGGYVIEEIKGLNGISPGSRSPLKSLAKYGLVMTLRLIADDARYLQFAFRVRPGCSPA